MSESITKVLFVDDDADFINLLKAKLRKEDYEMVTAMSGAEAIEAFNGNQPIDVVVTDFKMPHMNGDELVERLSEISPGTKAIIVSAHTEAVVACRMVSDGKVFCVIPKPTDFEYLKETIKSALRFASQATP